MRKFKEISKILFVHLGLINVFRYINRTPRILFWHGVDRNVDPEIEPESFELSTFKKQIEYLIKHYEIISMDDFYVRCKSQNFTGKEIVLTFDDGYVNNLTIISPYLQEKKLPYVVFVSTGHIETGELFPTSIARLIILGSPLREVTIPTLGFQSEVMDSNKKRNKIYKVVSHYLKTESIDKVREIIKQLKANISEVEYRHLMDKYPSVKPMNWDQLSELKRRGATIGSHCQDHICCHEKQDINEVVRQIKQSKHLLEHKLGISCDYFAYPNGDYTTNSNREVLAAGYKMGFTTKKIRISTVQNLAAIPRLGVSQNPMTFKIQLSLYPKR